MTYNKADIMRQAWTAARRRFAQLSEPSSLNGWGARKPVLRALFAEALRNAWGWAKHRASGAVAAREAANDDPEVIRLRRLIACEEAKERFVDHDFIAATNAALAARYETLGACHRRST